MHKNFTQLILTAGLISSFTCAAQSPDWKSLASYKEITKACTYKNTTYALPETGGVMVLRHGSNKVQVIDKYNSPLPSNSIRDIVVTADSVLYLASQGAGLIEIKNGLYKKIFGNSTWTSLSVSDVTEAPNGDIWFSGEGFDVFQLTKTGLIEHASPQGNTIGYFNDMKFSPTGELWGAGLWGISRYNGSTWTTYKPFGTTSFTGVEFDANGNVFVSAGDALLRFDGTNWSVFKDPNDNLSPFGSMFKDRSGKMVIYSSWGWSSFDPLTSNWANYTIPVITTPYKAVVPTNQSDLFVTTPNEFVLERPGSKFTFPYKSGIPFQGQASAFLEDSHGNTWLGTNSNGLYRISKSDTAYYSYSGGLTDSQIYAIVEDKQGKVWVSGPNRLHYYDQGSFHEVKNKNIPYFAVQDMLVDDDNSLWCASSLGLIHISSTDTTIYNITNSGIPDNYLKAIEKDKNGHLMIACQTGMIKFDKVSNWFLYTPDNSSLPSIYIEDTETDAFGNVWIGSMNYGNPALSVWDGTTFTGFHIDAVPPAQTHAMDLSIDKYGNKWIASQSHGLGRFDGNRIQYYTSANSGIPEGNLYAVYVRPNGDLIVGGYGSVVTFHDPADYLDTSNVKGIVFNDENKNGVMDGIEKKLPFARLKIWGSSKVIYANGNGEFSIALKADDYLISPAEASKWAISGTVLPLKVPATGKVNLNVPFQALVVVAEPEISLSGGFPRCNTDVPHVITVRNDGTKLQFPQIKLITASALKSTFPTPDFTYGDTTIWSLPGLQPGEQTQLKTVITMPGFDGTFAALARVDFHDADGVHKGSKIDSLSPEIRCAYDPNDKSVHPKGLGKEKYLLISQPATYHIRFQNTGNDTAFQVTVSDTLSPLLDYGTFEFLAASHKAEVSQQDSVLVFRFKNILLPDSTTNNAGSNGFVSFRVKPKANIAEKSILKNNANIYFDYNPAIVTNTTINTLVSAYPQVVTGLFASPNTSNNGVLVYPNPARDFVELEVKGLKSGVALVYNLEGVLLSSTEITSETTRIATSALQKGMYVLKVESGQESRQVKFVK